MSNDKASYRQTLNSDLGSNPLTLRMDQTLHFKRRLVTTDSSASQSAA